MMHVTLPCRAALLGLALLPSLAVAAGPEPVPVYRQIKDWIVGCDNTRACTAVAAAQEDTNSLWLVVHREAGLNSALSLRVVGGASWDSPPLLDGQPLTASWHKQRDEYQTVLQVDGEAGAALVRQLRNGERLTAASSDGALQASLQGISAALLLIDSVQGRIGHASALVRPGTAADASVPPAPTMAKLPLFTAAPALDPAQATQMRSAVMAKAKADGDVFDQEGVRSLELQPLDSQHALALISSECGAYNCSYTLYRVGRAAPYVVSELPFEAPASEVVDSRLTGYVAFDSNSGELYGFDKGRGIGDCGVNEIWRYDGERMRLLSLAKMDRCAQVSSEYWPVLWRAGK